MKVYVLHDNVAWLAPFGAAFEREGIPWEPWPLGEGAVDLDAPPPPGVFWSRVSASSHTRGRPGAKDHARAVLSWLEAHGRRVVNGRRVLEMEVSKVDQLTALRAAGFDVPRTIAVSGRADVAAQGRRLPVPLIVKHNQGGKGLHVHRVDSHGDLDRLLASADWEDPVDGITLLQEYVEPARPFVTRVEVVGGEVLYALTADTRHGFELCPAEACVLGDDGPAAGGGLFRLRDGFDDPIGGRYAAFARAHGIDIAGFEYIETEGGRQVTYDVNTNTNYNPDVDARALRSGPLEVARHLGRLLGAEEVAA